MYIPLPMHLNPFGHTIFNLENVIKVKSKFTSSEVDLTQTSSWPDADSTDLDPSQMKALQAALNQEISVIQGPPGTGKTYVGLKIVQSFLANRKVWDPKKTTPILVVCYTNHALDQFLEEIRSNVIEGKPPNVTRIGGRSKNEMLQDCLLDEKTNRARECDNISFREIRNFQTAESEKRYQKQKIKNILDKMTCPTDKILHIAKLEPIILEIHYHQLVAAANIDNPIELWLGVRLEDIQMQEDANYKNLKSWEVLEMKRTKKEELIHKQHKCGLDPMSADKVASLPDIWTLNKMQRWSLYFYWREQYITYIKQQLDLEGQSESYKASCEEFQRKKQDMQIKIVQKSDIVGMTTTGAAKHNYIIKAMKPKILVVEEAAEISEPHLFTSLSSTVQQLVLIGDHQQLRPKPTYYELETKYTFNVSLFERLAMNGCPVQTLNIQHRMRPEIASLITPAIYKELHNHDSVFDYSHVQGISKNIFFITHIEPELAGADDRQSHSNPHEAKYLGALCDYLLKQEYKSEEITILTLYRGQLLEIKNILGQKKIKGVRIAVVDDFQGEENRIILLSLVRSNNEQKIGFVGIKNRVCVALSRAKMSLFIIGNVEMLRDKVQTVWPKIIERLTEMGSIGNALPLHCHLHQDQKIHARVVEDFLKCPEGGCQKKCNARLPCGHVCPKFCHPYDIEHRKFKCQKICKKQLSCGHLCKHKCFQCSTNCQPCKEKVIKIIPFCGHSENCYCSDNVTRLKCSKICEKTLGCGHFCQEKCSQPCTYKCRVKVDKNLPCGHNIKDSCYINQDQIQCSHPCGALLDCEHLCTGTCYSCNMGRLHIGCTSKCDRILTCGHTCEFPCTPSCPPCTKPCANYCTHSHCPKKCSEPCALCMEPCDWSCPHFTCTQPCGMPCDRPPCNQPCKKRLEKCGHLCIGLCGEVCPKICRICDKEVITEIFFGNEDKQDARFILLPDCNHIIEVTILDQWMFNDIDTTGNNTVEESRTDEDTETTPENTTETPVEPQAVTLKVCPKCKTPVRKCFRYGNVKSTLKDIEIVKNIQMSAIDSINLPLELGKLKCVFSKDVHRLFRPLPHYRFIASELESIETMLQEESIPGKHSSSTFFSYIVNAKISFLKHIVSAYKTLNQIDSIASETYQPRLIGKIKIFLNQAKKFIMQDFLSQQQLSDAEFEIRRIILLVKVTELQVKCNARFRKFKLTQEENDYFTRTLSELEESGWKSDKIAIERERSILEDLESLCEKYSINGFSKTERLEIMKEISLPKCNWYKCPNGHFYAIGNYGRDILRSRCPECKIGGMNHILVNSNLHAPEENDSKHDTWPASLFEVQPTGRTSI